MVKGRSTSVYLHTDVEEKLNKWCEENERTRSEAINMLLKKILEDN